MACSDLFPWFGAKLQKYFHNLLSEKRKKQTAFPPRTRYLCKKTNRLMKNNDWKDRLNIVYSTNPDFAYQTEEAQEEETLDKEKQNLRVSIEKKNRGGKTATVVKGFIGSETALKDLAKLLKTRCGVGGAAKDGEIIIQGDLREKVVELLKKEGYARTK